MSNDYHDQVKQPYRIQKRLALNQCFKAIRDDTRITGRVTYVTFGGDDIYDVMDLLSVFDIREHEFKILSYEQDRELAEAAKSCSVRETLTKVKSVTIEIASLKFPDRIEELLGPRAESETRIVFLDYTGTFREDDAKDVEELIVGGLLRSHDYLLITSCLTPRVVHQTRFMYQYRAAFQLHYGTSQFDQSFRILNHVDLLIRRCLSTCERRLRDMGGRVAVVARLMRKYRYADTRAPMSLWLYALEQSREAGVGPTIAFDEFPAAFAKTAALTGIDELPDIF